MINDTILIYNYILINAFYVNLINYVNNIDNDNMKFQGHQKVHIVSVGFEVDRVVLPIKEIGGDKVYIIRGLQDYPGSQNVYREYIDEVKDQVKEFLKEEMIEEIECDIYDISNLISIIAKLVKTEKDCKNDVLINVSCGTKLYSAASIIAGLMYKASPYYAEVEEYIPDSKDPKFYRNGKPMGISKGIKKELIAIPEFNLIPPEKDLIQILSIINNISEPKTQSIIIKKLEQGGIMSEIYDENEKKVNRKALAQFRRRYLEPMINRKWILKEGQRRNARLILTEDGKLILSIFENVYLSD